MIYSIPCLSYLFLFNAENDQELYECPMCHLVCSKYQILQEHVELHLECNFLGKETILLCLFCNDSKY